MHPLRIYIEHVSKTFTHPVKGRLTAVDDVDLEVLPGELLTLLGPSGCGKTTSLRMVAGFESPSRGRIHFGDKDVTERMVNQRNLGFVFQNYALFPHLSVFENVAYGLRVQRKSERDIRAEVADVLQRVGLAGYEPQFPNRLSGGEQQRVALARAIVIRPHVLLFDEPLSNLDAKLRVRTRVEIRRLQKSLGITSIYVTHDQEEAMAISDRIAVMNRGRIVQIGTAEALYFRPATGFVARFIGKINTFPARRVDRGAIEVFGHAYRLPGGASSPAAGGELEVCVRPEMVRLVADAAAADFQARIVERSFLGEKVEYTLEAAGCSFLAAAHASAAQDTFAPGLAVGVQIEAEQLMLLPEEDETEVTT
jgi:iron(III) transport system ATP-binding protein